MLNWIDQNNYQDYYSPRIDSLLLVRNGFIVLEEYFNFFNENMTHRLYSVTKSITSALVGIAIREGFIESINQPILDFFPEVITPEMNPEKYNITVEHLLTMTAGLFWSDDFEMMPIMVSQSNPYLYVLGQNLIHKPGDVFQYSSGLTHVLAGIIHRSTGMFLSTFAEEYLFNFIGIDDYIWETDATGNSLGGSAIFLEPRDMAKFGYLYLQKGNWDGKQLVPEEWVENSTRLHIDLEGFFQELDYGWLWWMIPTSDRIAYTAMGHRGQFITILPDDNAVLVFTGDFTESYSYIFELMYDYIFPLLDKALETKFPFNIVSLVSLLEVALIIIWRRKKNRTM
ncbi:MAG: serine hydrolase [Asgard group archaeon]|nr:serine hydrolase [Asgard group archaeon]